MPPIFGIYDRHADQLSNNVGLRLHGPDREGMDERSGRDWSRILEPRDAALDALGALFAVGGAFRLLAIHVVGKDDGDSA
jgi:hypothetical protein